MPAGQLQQPLQPADSSTTHTFAGLAGLSSNNAAGSAWRCDVLQQADQMDCDSAAAGGSSGLVRTSSAPELLKLSQADSAAWQAMHGGPGTQQQSALLSHHVSVFITPRGKARICSRALPACGVMYGQQCDHACPVLGMVTRREPPDISRHSLAVTSDCADIGVVM
jgi:hypothetical protein